uniref:tRNA epoxyqueuosine(34) reductase QueG n=1 Tax=candidate division WOR-3 bacterium TaxID=2052148 RepID=A0A7V4E4G1_UNCW3
MISKKIIKEMAFQFGIEVYITKAEPFIEEKERIKEQRDRGLFLKRYWSDEEIEKFCEPQSVLKEAKSIIVSYLFYYTYEEKDPSQEGNPYGFIARYTRRNYYKELKIRLKKLVKVLKKEYGGKFFVSVNGPIIEKPMAVRSGLGYYGKHSIIIHPNYGSWIVLGEIITDLEMEVDSSLEKDCGNCQLCIETCPTKAIIEPYIIDRKKCIQDLSSWLGIIPDEIKAVWQNRLYGCDTCQEVCPVNKKVKEEEPKTEIGIIGAYLPLIEILNMDEKTFRTKYGNNQISASWIDFNVIKRNALIALGNIKDKKTILLIEKYLKENNPILKDAADWALKQF